MNDSSCVSRIGALAAALGIGTAVFTGCAVSSADTGSPDSSGATAAARSAPRHTSDGTARRAAVDRRSSRGSIPGGTAATPRTTASTEIADLQPRPRASRRDGAAKPATPAAIPAAQTATPAARVFTTSTRGVLRTPAQVAAAAPRMSALVAANALAPVNPNALPPKVALHEVLVSFGSSLMGLAQAAFRTFSVGIYLGPTTSTLNQTLDVNGYKLVPSSTEEVTSFYGQWAFWPGGPTLIQGKQQYDVVDPTTQETVGGFDALVSTGSPFNVRSKYVELLVTANDGVNVGTGPGQAPPVGSLISSFDVFAGFGWSYSAMPSGPDAVIQFKLTTPFGDIPVPMKFNAAKGIADHTMDNEPIDLANGYSIAPADPDGEIYIGTSGFLPYYTTIQAREVFNVRDSDGNTVGSFEGVVTPTADIMGVHTQAILVTDVISGSVGTAAGNTPPIGSVYNVMYEADGKYALYTALRSPSGNLVSTILVDGTEVSNIGVFPFNVLDAAAPPPVKRLPVAGGFSYLPISPLVPSGVNGLPPREVQVQGYQRFGVYDSAGVLRGSFDADVFEQWDMYGIHSQAILVTHVVDGTAGTTPGDVPPVGSTFNYIWFGKTGFGTSDSTLLSASGNKTSFKILTPLIDIPTWSTFNSSAGLDTVTFATA